MGQVVGNYSGFGMEQLLVSVGAVLAVVLVFIGILLFSRYRSRKYLMAKIRREWGKEPEREYDPTEYDCISHYYLNRATDEFQIDDITWNDLEMDRMFMHLNHTRSFLGESYLYYQLRTPALSAEKTEEFETLVSYYQTHVEEREALEYFFARIGKTGRSSIFDYIYNMSEAECRSNLVHYLMIAFLLLSVGVLFVNPQPGILLLIAAAGASIGTYERYKRPIRPYVTSCLALERVLHAAEEMQKQKLQAIEGCKEEIETAAKSFRRLRWNMFFLVVGEQQGGGLEQAFVSYLNNFFHIDLITFPYIARRIEQHIPQLEVIVEQIGRIESAIAVASYRALHPEYTVPVLHETGEPGFTARDMVHPLIQEPVPNSLCSGKSVLVTGSNASGKSTFLKTAALSALLAQTIHTVTAASYEARYFRIFSSMALRDDLLSEESYYIVEIRSLKRIIDRMREPVPILCCIDEVLRGTNTIERIAASSQILRSMAAEHMVCLAATHDIELTWLLEDCFDNYHFEEEVTEDSLNFDYQIKPGRAHTRNAIHLLRLMGYEPSMIQAAEQMAEQMLVNQEQVWAR